MSKIVLVAVAVLIFLLIAASALGYFLYLGPRMEVKSFTEDLAPQVERDVRISNELSSLFEKLDSGDEELDPEQFSGEVKEVKAKLESAQSEYQDVMRRIEALDTSERTSALKKEFVALNQFYIDEIPQLLEMVNYMDKLVESIDKFIKATEASGNVAPDATPEEAAAEIDKMSTAFKTVVGELRELEPPEGFEELHKQIVSALTEMSALLDETTRAIATLDLAALTGLEAKYDALDAKYGEDLGIEESSDEMDKVLEEAFAEEKTVIENAGQEVGSIKAKWGDRWVSDGLNFNITEGWMRGME